MLELLKERDIPIASEKLRVANNRLKVLLSELSKKELPIETEKRINAYTRQVNTTLATGDALTRKVEKASQGILRLVEKELQLVPRNHYRNQWMTLGMAAFGLPLGMVYATALDNYGLMGLGMPIGIGIGLGVGTSLDKKAEDSGKQLALE